MFVIPFVVHRRPKLWPDPNRFDPDRFAPEHEAERPRFAYIPFGGGPRGCIGNQFAMLEAQLIVAAIAQRYRIELLPDQEIRPEPLITLRPKPEFVRGSRNEHVEWNPSRWQARPAQQPRESLVDSGAMAPRPAAPVSSRRRAGSARLRNERAGLVISLRTAAFAAPQR